jgi:CHAD domain-containing protein
MADRGDRFFTLLRSAPETLETEIVHDLRVASRRLREGLRLFAPCYAPEDISRLQKKIRNITSLLGALRDIDEALLFFSPLAATAGPAREVLEELITDYHKRRQREHRKLAPALRALHAGPLQRRFYRIVAAPRLFDRQPGRPHPFSTTLADFGRQALNDDLAAIMELVPAARQEGEAKAQHRLRIAVKHFRYRLEILSCLAGSGFRGIHDPIKRYQELLGKIHDLDVFAEVVVAHAPTNPGREELLAAIGKERHQRFEEFLAWTEAAPIPAIGEKLRSL